MKEKTGNDFFTGIETWLRSRGEVAWARSLEARKPSLTSLPGDLPEALRIGLAARGIEKLYSHQARAYELARAGRHFVVITPTASGKTLCYNLPVVQTLLEDPEARALYLFPTKALSQDQQSELNELAQGGSLPLKIQTYDGDTPSSLRTAARSSGRIIISNPDMLHSGILPNHPKWINFFSGLRYVVVDEMHSYRGVFGSHVGNVIRRLRRVAAFYGAHPCFIFCSATIGNPRELAASLLEEEVELVDKNGSGAGEKRVIFYNPPLVDSLRGVRKSSALESQAIALELLRRGVKTILFARSRLQVELVASYMTKALENPFNENNRIRVSPYRSGLLPSERRAIERDLREGRLQGVVSTNALELGIDIGGLDASVIAGYPGSAASFWQQAGRAGRRGSGSLAVFVASSAPLDQYFARHPEYFLSQGLEMGRVDLDNPYIFIDHLKCSAFELPFRSGEAFGTDSAERRELTQESLSMLEEGGTLRLRQERWYWSDEGYPSEKISLRSATADNVVIVDMSSGTQKAIGEMDRASAKELLFPNAVYIHLGRQYMVTGLDITNRLCSVIVKTTEYWTDAVVKTDLSILTEDEAGRAGGAAVALGAETSGGFSYSLGDVLVRSQAEKFKKLTYTTHENIGYGDIDLPPEETQTMAISLLFPPGSKPGDYLAGIGPASAAAVLVGAGRLFQALCPAFLLCSPGDIGLSERVRDPHFGIPAIHLYDKYPGGTGLSEALAPRLGDLASAALERVGSCACAGGCPSCVGADLEMPETAADRGRIKASVSVFLRLCAQGD